MNRSKRALLDGVARTLEGLDGVRSITFVGSFVDREDLSGISDVDTVVVFDRLTPERFDAAVKAVGALTGSDVGFPDRRLIVNATLGPLKFDTPDQVVIHLMPYDIASHREHALKSPFTCFDWERSEHVRGTSLRDLYPVGRLQPGDFVTARRGLANYLSDLEAGVLSFRRFEADADRMTEIPDSTRLDGRHAGEYAFHIVRNLIVNALKLRTGRNELWPDEALVADWRRELPELEAWIPFYQELRGIKAARGHDFPAAALSTARAFVTAFAAWIDSQIAGAFRLRLVRHARTALNDGTFLGVRRDPPAADLPAALDAQPPIVYASPLRRARDTAAALAPDREVLIDARLSEIDYGLAEGLTATEAQDRFPSLRDAWQAGRDTPFPEGEDTARVLERVRQFLDALPPGAGEAVAVTHNVVIRALVADLLGLDLQRAHRIPIAHLEPIDIRRIGGRWMPDLQPALKARILDGYVA